MPETTCRRCRTRLIPVYPGQTEHPGCSPTDTGWVPDPQPAQATLADVPTAEPAPAAGGRFAGTLGPDLAGMQLALALAAVGWHVFPLAPASKRPLANCPACRDGDGSALAAHPIEGCPCLPAGRWCHGVRAATTDPDRITAWWTRQPAAVPGVAAGPSGLVLVDLDAHGTALPDNLATGLLPGIDLAAEAATTRLWTDPSRFRDGRDTLALLGRVRGGTRPWPTDPAHQPVTVPTPSGGRHLWYRAPITGLRQALYDREHNRGLGWQIDIKAGWNYGIAPGATTHASHYPITAGDVAAPGHMPTWLAREIVRVTAPGPIRPAPTPAQRTTPGGPGPAAYLTTVIDRGSAQLAKLKDGRQRALSALAYQAGGLLAWSGLQQEQVTNQLVTAGTASGLTHNLSRRIVRRALVNGMDAPLAAPECPAGPPREEHSQHDRSHTYA